LKVSISFILSLYFVVHSSGPIVCKTV